MAKREFNENSGLGFMRFIQFMNVVNIFLVLVAMLFVSGAKMPIDLLLVSVVAELVSMSVLIWMIARRKMYTRQVAVGCYVVDFVTALLPYALSGTLTVYLVVSTLITPLLLSTYFLTSRRAKAVLVQPFDARLRDKELAVERKMWDPKSVDFWMRLLIYFFVFSVVGHWMEMFVQILVINGLFPGTVAGADSLTWRDNLNPFFIYGIAFAICGLVLFPIYVKLKEKIAKTWLAYLISFFVNMAFCVLAELVLGFLFNADYSAWDYRDQFLNFEGQVCLLYSLAFGLLSSIITWQVYPYFERQFSYVGKDIFRLIFVASAVIFALLYVTYNVDLARLGVISEQDETTLTESARSSFGGDAGNEQSDSEPSNEEQQVLITINASNQ